MARYVLKTAHFLDSVWYPAGAEIEWSGTPSKQMVPSAEWKNRREQGNDGKAQHHASVVSNPNANPPVVTGNIFPAKAGMAGPEAPAEAVAGPQDERNPDFVPPNQSRPIHPGVAEDLDAADSERAKKAKAEADEHAKAAAHAAPATHAHHKPATARKAKS
jgi:hypothetical protein